MVKKTKVYQSFRLFQIKRLGTIKNHFIRLNEFVVEGICNSQLICHKIAMVIFLKDGEIRSVMICSFFVFLVGLETATEAGRATTFKREIKARHYKQEIHKMKDIPKTWVFYRKQIEGFRRKKTKDTPSLDQTTP